MNHYASPSFWSAYKTLPTAIKNLADRSLNFCAYQKDSKTNTPQDHNYGRKFWLHRWENNDIGFHNSDANPLLVQYFPALSLADGSRVFLPLCGKTRDIGWLLMNGYRVAGAELSEMAIEQLFAEVKVTPEISEVGELRHYQAPNIDIFVGDLFALSGETLGPVDAIYDRAAWVALPEGMRPRYAAHLMEITDSAPQLLITYEYDQHLMDGPPFSISPEEVGRHYGNSYDVSLLASVPVTGRLKERVKGESVTEKVWKVGGLSEVGDNPFTVS